LSHSTGLSRPNTNGKRNSTSSYSFFLAMWEMNKLIPAHTFVVLEKKSQQSSSMLMMAWLQAIVTFSRHKRSALSPLSAQE
jgi:hypothetical protein